MSRALPAQAVSERHCTRTAEESLKTGPGRNIASTHRHDDAGARWASAQRPIAHTASIASPQPRNVENQAGKTKEPAPAACASSAAGGTTPTAHVIVSESECGIDDVDCRL